MDAGITNLADIKAYIKVTADTDNTLITKLGKAASSVVETYCERKFADTEHADKYNGGVETLILKTIP